MSTIATSAEGPQAKIAAPSFQQRLGLFDATMLIVGTMIGSGIFIVSADMARDLGSSGWLLAAWLLTALMTILGALSYTELAAMMPHAGGQYVYLREAYSPLWGFLYGWTCFLVIQTGSIAAVGVAFAKYLGVLVPSLGTDNMLWEVKNLNIDLQVYVPWLGEKVSFFKRDSFGISAGQFVAVAIIAFLTLLNCRGVQEGKVVQNLFTVAKTLALIVLIVVGLTVAANAQAIAANTADLWNGIYQTERFGDVSKLAAGLSGLAIVMVVGGAMVGSLFAADAWNNITFTAGEVKDPRRNLPLSLMLGVGLVLVLYLLANVAYLTALPVRGDAALAEELQAQAKAATTPEAREAVDKRYLEATAKLGIDHARDDRVATATMQLAAPRVGVPFMAVAIMISTFGCINGMILMGARLYYAMARDRLFFQSVGTLNARGVPQMGLLAQGLWTILLVFSGSYGDLLDYVIFAVLVFYVLTVSGLFILRRTRPDAERPYKAWGYPVLPALYVFLCAVVMLDLLIVKPTYTWPGLLIVLAGIPVYFVWRLRASRRAAVDLR
jgi:APA family basic amino acid/polyamine antiporter